MKFKFIILILLVTGCSSANVEGYDPTTSVMSQFFKALVTGDTSKIKDKQKNDDKEWEDISEN
tara:strand:+ start:2069 stop:2257 length:189 start_codon:yes stop_codon:yes gene_type:complete